MRAASEKWLFQTIDICRRTGFLRSNLRFCTEVSGPDGKGVIAEELKLTHFVDDRDDALASVYSDAAGNAGASIDRHGGQLFHFGRHGNIPPGAYSWPRFPQRPHCVIPVANWSHLFDVLNVLSAEARPRAKKMPRRHL